MDELQLLALQSKMLLLRLVLLLLFLLQALLNVEQGLDLLASLLALVLLLLLLLLLLLHASLRWVTLVNAGRNMSKQLCTLLTRA